LDDFAGTFSARSLVVPIKQTGGVFKSLFALPGVASLIAATGAAALASQILWACYCHALTWAFFVTPTLIVVVLVRPFEKKRRDFVQYEVYDLEEELFRCLNAGPVRELQVDVLGVALAAVTLAVITVLLIPYKTTLQLVVFWTITAAVAIGALFMLATSFRRPGAWRFPTATK
jgi:hypothetical protein